MRSSAENWRVVLFCQYSVVRAALIRPGRLEAVTREEAPQTTTVAITVPRGDDAVPARVVDADPVTGRARLTLPEAVLRATHAGSRGADTLDAWCRRLNAGRASGLDYFDDPTVGEVVDPTGRDRATWATSVATIDLLTRRLAEAVAR